MLALGADALSRSMTSCVRSPDYVGLKPMWKGNLCLFLLAAVIVLASISAFIAK